MSRAITQGEYNELMNTRTTARRVMGDELQSILNFKPISTARIVSQQEISEVLGDQYTARKISQQEIQEIREEKRKKAEELRSTIKPYRGPTFSDLINAAWETTEEATVRRFKTGFEDERYAVTRLLKSMGAPIKESWLQQWKEEGNIQVWDLPLKVAGKVEQLLALQALIGVTPLPGAIESTIGQLGMSNKFGMANMVYQGFLNATKWGAGGAIDQISKVIAGDEEVSHKLITEPIKEGLFGLSLGSVAGIKNIPTRVILSGMNRGTWSLINGKLQDGKIDKQDVVNALMMAGIATLTEGIGAYKQFKYIHKSQKAAREFIATGREKGLSVDEKNIMKEFNKARFTGNIDKMKELSNAIGVARPEMKAMLNEFIRMDMQAGYSPQFPKHTINTMEQAALNRGVKLDHQEANKLLTILASDPSAKHAGAAILTKKMPSDFFTLATEKQKMIFDNFTYSMKSGLDFNQSIAKSIENIPAKDMPSAVQHYMNHSQTLQKEAIPTARKILKTGKDMGRFVQEKLAPTTLVTPEEKSVLIKQLGIRKYQDYMFEVKSQKWKKMVDNWNDDQLNRWIHLKEAGQLDTIQSEFKEQGSEAKHLAEFIQEVSDTQYKYVSEIKKIGYIQNKLPHLNVKKLFPYLEELAQENNNVVFQHQYFARRPPEGKHPFTKHRIYATQAEGEKAGVQYIKNPIDAMAITQDMVGKYVGFHKTIDDLQKIGSVKWIKPGQQATEIPKSWIKMEGKSFEKYFKVPTKHGSTVMMKGQELWAHPDVARLLHNYTSPNDWMKNPFKRTMLNANRLINMSNLSLSPFHLGVTCSNALGISFGFGVRDAVKSIKTMDAERLGKSVINIMKSPMAGPLHMWYGRQIVKGAAEGDPQLKAYIANYYEHGSEIGVPKDMTGYLKELKLAWKDKNYFSAATKAIPALMEASMKPLMQYAIPYLKVSMFNEYATRLWDDYKDTKSWDEVLNMASERVDWAFGKLHTDTLYWDKNTMALAHTIIRSVGWNHGTGYLYGMAAKDAVKMVKDFFNGKETKFTLDMWVLASIAMATAAIGGIYHLTHTGESPKEFKDFVFPKSGSKDAYGNDIRVTLPGYGKDFVYWHTAPLKTLKAKFAPGLALAYRMMTNQTYFGDMIWNSDDPVMRILQDQMEYITEAIVPFSFSQFKRSIDRGERPARVAESMLGITESRREYRESAITKKIFKEFRDQTKVEFRRTPEGQDLIGEKAKARREILMKGEYDTFFKLFEQGKIKDANRFLQGVPLSGAQRAFKQLSLERKYALYDQMSEEEKDKYAHLFPQPRRRTIRY